MGQARAKMRGLVSQAEKEQDAAKLVAFDFQAPRCITREQSVPAVVRTVMIQVVTAAHPQIDRVNGREWAVWQELLIDEPDGVVEIAKGKVKWLRDLFAGEAKVHPALSQPREAVLDYLEALLAPDGEAAG